MFLCFSFFVLRVYFNFDLFLYCVHVVLFCCPAFWPQKCINRTTVSVIVCSAAVRWLLRVWRVRCVWVSSSTRLLRIQQLPLLLGRHRSSGTRRHSTTTQRGRQRGRQIIVRFAPALLAGIRGPPLDLGPPPPDLASVPDLGPPLDLGPPPPDLRTTSDTRNRLLRRRPPRDPARPSPTRTPLPWRPG